MLTARRLQAILQYEPDTGLFRWRINGRGCFIRKGAIAGTINSQGYRQMKVDGSFYKASRLAFLWMTGKWPKKIVDHINCQKGDDRWENLRDADYSQNGANMRVRREGLKGVVFNKRRGTYSAFICKDYHVQNLGRFDSEEDAHAAYVAEAKRRFGEYANDGTA